MEVKCMKKRKKGNENNPPRQLAHWIELNIPENIDISSWLNPKGTLNAKKMQKEAKKTILESHRKRQEWQERAILDSLPTD